MFGIQVLRVLRFEWLTLLPAWGFLAHTLHFAITASLFTPLNAVYNLLSVRELLCLDDLENSIIEALNYQDKAGVQAGDDEILG